MSTRDGEYDDILSPYALAEEAKQKIDVLAEHAYINTVRRRELVNKYGGNQVKVLFAFLDHSHRWLNAREVAAYTRIDYKNVHRYLDVLLRDRVIIEKITPSGRVYRLNPKHR